MKAVGFGGGFEFQVVVIAVVAYVLDTMDDIVEMCHFHGAGFAASSEMGRSRYSAQRLISDIFLRWRSIFHGYCTSRRLRVRRPGYGNSRAGEYIMIKKCWLNWSNISSVFFTIWDICSILASSLKICFYFCE